jgi:SAM-dependent methyltransferase
MTTGINAYDQQFFTRHTKQGLDSAKIIVPQLLKLVQPKSVVDIGCGTGAWLKVFQENGVKTVCGLDGGYIDKAKLQIDPKSFINIDLAGVIDVTGQYDLAICLEVAEHLPPSQAPHLTRALASLAPLILFSAAIPGQGGTNHVNEQWPSYWKLLFAETGFKRLDPIRRHIWNDSRIAFWYRQNIFLYAAAEAIQHSEVLKEEERLTELDIIYIDFLKRHNTLRGVLRMMPKLFCDAVERRITNYVSRKPSEVIQNEQTA